MFRGSVARDVFMSAFETRKGSSSPAGSAAGDRRRAPRQTEADKPATDRRSTPRGARRALSDLARTLSREPVQSQYSGAVITGLARGGELALIMLSGALAIMFFTPEHPGWVWLEALLLSAVAILAVIAMEAAHQGLRVPIVYNTNAYDAVSVLRL